MSCVPMKLGFMLVWPRAYTQVHTCTRPGLSSRTCVVAGVGCRPFSQSFIINPEALLPTSHCLILGRKRQRRRPCPGQGLSLRRRHSSAVHVGLGLGRRVPHGAQSVW